MVGSAGNPARGNLRVATPQVGECRRVPRSPPDGRSSRSTGLSLVARWSNLACCLSTSHDDGPVQADASTAQHGLSADAVGDHADPRPSSRVAARRTDAFQEHTGADTADADAGHWTTDAHTGHWTPDAWTSHSRALDANTGHRTPDTGRADADRGRGQATKARLASGRPRTPRRVDRPLGCQTVFLCGQPMQRSEP